MTCREAQELIVESLPSEPPALELQKHLSECGSCAREFADFNRTLQALDLHVRTAPGFADRVTEAARRTESNGVPWWRLSLAAAIACALILCLPLLDFGDGEAPGAPNLLYQSVLAMSRFRSLHIAADASGMHLEIWRKAGQPGAWRAESPDTVTIAAAGSTVEYLKDLNLQIDYQRKPLPWFRELVQTEDILQDELNLIRAGGGKYELRERRHFLGRRELVLQTRRKAVRDLPFGILRGEGPDVEQTRAYRFDAATRRLTSMRIVLHARTGDRTVFETTKVRYDEPADANLFIWSPPKNVLRLVRPEDMPHTYPLPQSAKEAARIFLDACEREDWGLALMVVRMSGIPEIVKSNYKRLHVVSIGEPREASPDSWRVPYEIRKPGGAIVRSGLRLTNANPAHRWVIDAWM